MTMQVLTPSGYKFPFELANGDEVCAFNSGAPIINRVENIDAVDYKEWCRWWQHHDTLPPFNWYRINGSEELLFGEQSIWRNGSNVAHVKYLKVGDRIYDDSDHPVTITNIDVIEDRSLIWYRFDIDGDHSFIADRRTVHNASRFWVLGTGTWDAATTTNWSASSGGAGGQSVPGSADTVTFNASSGGGTVTVNFGGPITVQSIAMGAFTGTWDNSVNNNNITVTASAGFNGSGSGARTIKLGTATYTISGSAGVFTFATITNLTYTGNTGANIVFTGSTSNRSFHGGSGGLSHGNVTLGASSGAGAYTVAGASTIASLTITAPNLVQFGTAATNTITSAFNWIGSVGAKICVMCDSVGGGLPTINVAANSVAAWCAFRDVGFTGSPVAHNSFDLGNVSGITINAPNVTRSQMQAGF